MEGKWSDITDAVCAAFILYVILPLCFMFFSYNSFLVILKLWYILVEILLSSLCYFCMWMNFNRMREEGVISKDAKFSFISNLLFFIFFLSIPLLAPYSEYEGHYLPYFTLLFLTFELISFPLVKHFRLVNGRLIIMIVFCFLSLPFLIHVSPKTIAIFLISLAYFIASMLDIRRNRFPYFALAYLERKSIRGST
jgi:hypothetical protein